MIVDLLRNDLAKVAEPHSVRVEKICSLESYANVHHLTSVISAETRPGTGTGEIVRAVFPGGSITGAPKIRAMEILAELEPAARGPYCGAIGYLGLVMTPAGNGGWSVRFHAGGGVVAASTPAGEYQETLDKASAMIRTLSGGCANRAGDR